MIKKQIVEDMKQITLFIAALLISSSFLQAQNSVMEFYASGPNDLISFLTKFTDTDTTVVDQEIVNTEGETDKTEEEELEVEIGVITPMTRLSLPSDEDEPMVRMYDNNGNEYYIRRNPNPNWEEPVKTSWRKGRKMRRLKMKGKLPSV